MTEKQLGNARMHVGRQSYLISALRIACSYKNLMQKFLQKFTIVTSGGSIINDKD